MRSLALPRTTQGVYSQEPVSRLQRAHRRWSICLFAGVGTASVTGLFGLVLSGASLLHLVASGSAASITGTVLLTITFPVLVFAAHCLDKMDESNKAIRAEQLLANGIKMIELDGRRPVSSDAKL